MGDENVLGLEGGQALKCRQVTLAPPAAAAFGVERVVPHAQLTAACVHDGVTEDEGAAGGDLDRLLGARRAADRMEAGEATDVGTAVYRVRTPRRSVTCSLARMSMLRQDRQSWLFGCST
jgi:hypothetical protein